MLKSFNTYTIYARFFPGLISALPLFILWYYLSDNIEFKQLTSFILSLKFLGTISFSIVFLYFYSQLIRVSSKYFENKYFINDKGFPTTYLMTYSDNTFSDDYKDKYRSLIRDQFGFELLDKEQEKNGIVEARKHLNEAAKLNNPQEVVFTLQV